jgi:hypothetical protein
MYRVKSTGEIKSQGEIRQMYKNTSLPRVWNDETLEFLGVDPVFESPAPATNVYQTAYRDGVEQDSKGKWFWKWSIGPVFQDRTDENGTVITAAQQEADHKARIDEAKAADIRADRARRLTQTDWMALSDVTMSAEMAAYRQALRDVPSQDGFPHNVVWPVDPTASPDPMMR